MSRELLKESGEQYTAIDFWQWKKEVEKVFINHPCFDSLVNSYVPWEIDRAYKTLVRLYPAIMMDSQRDKTDFFAWDKMILVFHYNSGEVNFATLTFILIKGKSCKVVSWLDIAGSLKVSYTDLQLANIISLVPDDDCFWLGFLIVSYFDKFGELTDMRFKSVPDDLFDDFIERFYPKERHWVGRAYQKHSE